MKKEDQRNQSNHNAFFNQFFYKIFNSAFNQRRTVINRNNLDPFRQAVLQFFNLFLHALNHMQGVLPGAHHHDPGHNLAFAVKLCHTAPKLRSFNHAGDILQPYRRAVLSIDHNLLKFIQFGDIAFGADHHLHLALFNDPATGFHTGISDRFHQPFQRHVKSAQTVRIDQDLIFLHKPTDRSHLRHAGHSRQLKF